MVCGQGYNIWPEGFGISKVLLYDHAIRDRYLEAQKKS
jgi:hypothetical protein